MDTESPSSLLANDMGEEANINSSVVDKIPNETVKEQDDSLEYSVTPGQCNTSGQMYEVKVTSLLYLRAVRRKLDFILATSVKDAYPYDDIRFAYKTESGPKQMLVQLKHKESRSITKSLLLADESSKRGFSLQKYYKGYCSLRKDFEKNKVLNSYSEFENIDFILCTNAPAELCGVTFTDSDNILNMHGQVFSFSQNQTFINDFKQKLGKIDDRFVDEFFNQFYMYTNQTREDDLGEEIKKEIKLLFNISDDGAEKVGADLEGEVKTWHEDRSNSRKSLKINISKYRSGSEILKKVNEMKQAKLKFDNSVTAYVKSVLSTDVQIINCATDIEMCNPSCDMLQQSFWEINKKFLTVSLENFESSREDILHVWPSEWCHILVIYDSGISVSSKSLRNVSSMMKKLLIICKYAKLFLISKQGKLVETLFPDCSKSYFKEMNVTCEMKHLLKESKEQVFGKVINFQGSDVTVGLVLGERHEHAIDAHLLSLLAYSDTKVQIGRINHERVDFYIDRVLTRSSFINKSILTCNSCDIIAVTGMTENQMQTFPDFSERQSENDLSFQLKCVVDFDISIPNGRISFWYSDNSYIDTTLPEHNLFIRPLLRQMNELKCSGTSSYVPSQNYKGISTNVRFINSADNFDTLCEKHRNENVHWLNAQNGKLKWMKSQGDMNPVTSYASGEKELFSVKDVWDIPEKIVILSSDSGMGKTSLLHQIALNSKLEHPEYCVIQIHLIKCLNEFENLEQNITLENASKFLIQNSLQGGDVNQSSHIFLRCIITEILNVVVLLDGFDEVCQENECKIFNLIRCFCKLNISKLWITSRNDMSPKLEQITGCLKFELQPLTIEEGHRYYIEQLGNNDIQSSFLPSELVINFDLRLLQNPLHCKMMAEIYSSSKTTGRLVPGIGTLISLPEIIKEIVEIKFEVYSRKYIVFLYENKQTRKMIELYKNNFIENHQWSALLLLLSLSPEHKKKIRQRLDSFIEDVKVSNEKTGIISSFDYGMPQFENKIFADFFLAFWMAENCDGVHLDITQNILKRIIFDKQFSNIIDLFNKMTAKELELHSAIIHYDWISPFEDIKVQDDVLQVSLRDKAGRTPLHLALSAWNCDRDQAHVLLTKEEMQKHMIHRLIKLGAKLNIKDSILKWSPFRYSNIKTVPWSIVSIIMENNGVNGKDEQDLIERVKTERCDALAGLVYGVSKKSERLLSFLLKNGVCVDESINDMGDTALIISASLGDIRILKYLHCTWHANPEIRNKNGDTPLHWACLKGHIDIVKYLASKHSKAIEIKNNTGYTPLLAAAMGGHLKIVQYLKEDYESRVHERTTFGHSVLDFAAGSENDDPSLAKYLVKTCSLELIDNDQFGSLPFITACVMGNINILKFFIDQCGLNPLRELNDGKTLLHFMVQQPKSDPIKEFIASYKPSLDVTDHRGHTLFMSAFITPFYDVYEYLRGVCPNITSLSNEGNSVLHFYILHCLFVIEEKCVRYLVEKCHIDPNIVNCHGFMALDYAVIKSGNPTTSHTIEPSALAYLKANTHMT